MIIIIFEVLMYIHFVALVNRGVCTLLCEIRLYRNDRNYDDDDDL